MDRIPEDARTEATSNSDRKFATLSSAVGDENKFYELLVNYHNSYCRRAASLENSDEFKNMKSDDVEKKARFDAQDFAIIYEYNCLIRQLFSDKNIQAKENLWKFLNETIIGKHYTDFYGGDYHAIRI